MTNTVFLERVADLYDTFKRHDAQQADRLQRYRNIEAESAQLLSQLIRMQQAKTILEIGTSTGYSTLWLAEAAQATHGQVITLEIDATRSAEAKRHVTELELSEMVSFWVGDAADYLKEAQETYDFILLDAERNAYENYWPDLKRLIKPKGGVLIIDNVISHAAEVKPLLSLIKKDSTFMSTILPVGAGLCVVVAK
ncbi:Putative O-methyltransferase/MSMEI_4947 [Acinetobacter calcoaceticus]|jgi:predicted O-methyltransferase YrrM|uniref:O-methyltransferase/MSMEI_4947 n=1 Tax=Acinetobacter calcoaceticus TaxID=471 RepID=A0A446ZLA3_ACICA|nr:MULTISPECIES: O-methyltransferase [Acinetobacter]MCU4424569.1 O-methyltransferase [Acinetobacter sp. WU_MDCI_Abxb74]MEB3864025.1 O-methyltransferase [Acinetobacter sp. IK31]CAI3145650.1 Putative O-methyltransferase/MSMEI_4947 [Acinetobacter calcoaceticus]VAX45302.1 Putative O-methyltransferase/MSMEI_4947 [Acinetobacter calcoaceticus]